MRIHLLARAIFFTGILATALSNQTVRSEEPANASSSKPALDRVAEISSAGLGYFQRLPEIAFSYKEDFWRGGSATSESGKADISFSAKFAYSSPCFYFEKRWSDEQSKKGRSVESTITAYNGHVYQYRTGDMELCLTQDPSNLHTFIYDLPLWKPYIFAFSATTTNPLIELAAPQHWLDLVHSAKVIHDSSDAQDSLVEAEFKRTVKGNRTANYRVQLSPRLGYFPMSYSVENTVSGEICTVSVDKYTIVNTSSGPFLLPTLIRTKVVDRSGTATGCHEIIEVDESSIQADHKVPDEQFTISPTQASILYDMDLKTRIQLH